MLCELGEYNIKVGDKDQLTLTLWKDSRHELYQKKINFHKEDLNKLGKLKVQLDRLSAIGGFDAIVPSEGIVFKYNGKTYKFTGAFAPVNQITGMLTFGR